MIIIINLKLLNAAGEVKFRAYGNAIDERYSGVYESGDKYRVELCDGEFVKIKLDETLAESIIYVPDGIFEFEIPEGVTGYIRLPSGTEKNVCEGKYIIKERA